MNPTRPRSLSRLGRILVLAAIAVLPTLSASAQEPSKRRNQQTEEMLEQNRETARVGDALEKLARKRKELLSGGRHEEAEAVGRDMQKLGRWLEESERAANENRKQSQPGGQAELLEALEKATHALRKQNDERAAATVARFADEIAAQQKQREDPTKARWLRDREVRRAQFEDQENLEEAREEAARREAKDVEVKREARDRDVETRARARNEGPQDHRIDELAQQVERLTRIVEQLASRLEEAEKTRRVPLK